jgi:pimeloyl-ACP methyl ester carboxylesterase
MAVNFSRGSFLSLSPGGFHRLAYLDWGKSTANPVVVCVHGLSRNSRDFDYLARDLARDCRVICPDVVGRGDSEWLSDKSDYSFSTYLMDAAALIARITAPPAPVAFGTFRSRRKAVPGPATIDWVGTSMGGLIGMLLAAKRASPIRRLVLNDVGPFISWGSLYRLKGYIAGGGAFNSLADVEAYLREACAAFGPLTDEQWRHLAEHSAAPAGGWPEAERLSPEVRPGDRRHHAGERAGPGASAGAEFPRRNRPVEHLVRSPLPDAGAARRRIGCSVARDRGADEALAARGRSARAAGNRPRAGLDELRSDRGGTGVSASMNARQAPEGRRARWQSARF